VPVANESFANNLIVEIAGQPLAADIKTLLAYCYVDDSRNLPDTVVLRFRDTAHTVLQKANVTVGAPITVKVQTADPGGPQQLMSGEITAIGFDLDPWPNFYRFARLVCFFNVRALTYPGDVLDAFEGSLATLSTVFDCSFISGLPQMQFDAALLWQPYFPMSRRRASGDAVLPSWSWVGWEGSVHSEDWVAGCNYVYDDDKELRRPCSHTISTVSWTHSNSVEAPGESVVVSGSRIRERFAGKKEELPPGWHRMISSRSASSPGSFGAGSLRGYFWHDSDPSQNFWHPIPIREPSRPARPASRSKYLRGNTSMAQLRMVRMHPSRQEDRKRCADALLIRPDGSWVGYLRLNEKAGSISGPALEDCQVIELSRGSTTYSDGFTDRFREYLYPELQITRDAVYEFVNVMWIESISGVAYRKAVGRVLKSAWENMPRKEITVTLG